MLKKCFMFFTLLSVSIANAKESCLFDHQVATLSAETFGAVRNFLKTENIQKTVGANWKDDDYGTKGFLTFADGSYLEIWDKSKFGNYGYQDACRLGSKDSLGPIAKSYGVKIGEFKNLQVVGRTGWVGDPEGGMFFLWQIGRIISVGKEGIRQILKLVKQSKSGKINSEIIDDYKRAGLKLKFRENSRTMIATDKSGVSRVAVATANLTENGLIAVRFTRTGADTSTVLIQSDASGNSAMFLELTPKTGTLVFRADLYKVHSSLMLNM